MFEHSVTQQPDTLIAHAHYLLMWNEGGARPLAHARLGIRTMEEEGLSQEAFCLSQRRSAYFVIPETIFYT